MGPPRNSDLSVGTCVYVISFVEVIYIEMKRKTYQVTNTNTISSARRSRRSSDRSHIVSTHLRFAYGTFAGCDSMSTEQSALPCCYARVRRTSSPRKMFQVIHDIIESFFFSSHLLISTRETILTFPPRTCSKNVHPRSFSRNIVPVFEREARLSFSSLSGAFEH